MPRHLWRNQSTIPILYIYTVLNMELSAFTYIGTSNDDKEVGSSFIFTSEKKCLVLGNGKGMPQRPWVSRTSAESRMEIPAPGLVVPWGLLGAALRDTRVLKMAQEWGAPVSLVRRVPPHTAQELISNREKARRNRERMTGLLRKGCLWHAHHQSSRLDTDLSTEGRTHGSIIFLCIHLDSHE